jgi:hypothetical protein
MTIYKTPELIDYLEQQTENFLQKAVSEWQMISPSKLLQQPGENKWSAAQCIEHLNSYGRYYLPEIERAIEIARQHNWTSAELFGAGWLGDYFTKLMMPGTEGKKMKKMSAPKNHVPAANPDSHKVISEFIEQQEGLLLLLEKSRRIDIEKAKVPVSIAKFIRLKLGDTFRFLIAHNLRHVLQAERALATAAKQGEKKALILQEKK